MTPPACTVHSKTKQQIPPAPADAIGGMLVIGVEKIRNEKQREGSKFAAMRASSLLFSFTRNIDWEAARKRGADPDRPARRRSRFAKD